MAISLEEDMSFTAVSERMPLAIAEQAENRQLAVTSFSTKTLKCSNLYRDRPVPDA